MTYDIIQGCRPSAWTSLSVPRVISKGQFTCHSNGQIMYGFKRESRRGAERREWGCFSLSLSAAFVPPSPCAHWRVMGGGQTYINTLDVCVPQGCVCHFVCRVKIPRFQFSIEASRIVSFHYVLLQKHNLSPPSSYSMFLVCFVTMVLFTFFRAFYQ